jgi:hypothetical protein
MQFKFRQMVLGGLLAGCLMTSIGAQADEYNVKLAASWDPGTDTGAAVLGSTSSKWNGYNNDNTFYYLSSGASLVDDTGPNTSVLFTLTYESFDGSSVKTNATSSPSFLMGTTAILYGGSWNISLTGLAANTTYQFIGYGTYAADSVGSTWTVLTGTAGSGVFTNTGDSADISTGAGNAYVNFEVTTDATGSLVVQVTSDDGWVPLNGFQLATVASVPEASTWVMMLGGLALLGLRARKNTA